MGRTIQATIEETGPSCVIELREDEAPATCRAIRDALPIEGSLIHGKVSGDEVFVPVDDDEVEPVDPENWEFNAIPRDVGYWYSYWGDGDVVRGRDPFGEIVFVYGREIRIRKGADRNSAVNLFGRVTEGFEEYAAACERVQTEGPKRVVLERRED